MRIFTDCALGVEQDGKHFLAGKAEGEIFQYCLADWLSCFVTREIFFIQAHGVCNLSAGAALFFACVHERWPESFWRDIFCAGEIFQRSPEIFGEACEIFCRWCIEIALPAGDHALVDRGVFGGEGFGEGFLRELAQGAFAFQSVTQGFCHGSDLLSMALV